MNDNRRKLTGILKLLYENTDAEHYMDTYQIMDALESMGYGRPDRKTIDANIKYLIEDLGFGIVKEKGKPNRYKWSDREFELSELKMLVDAVHSSRFITTRKAREIIVKLKDLTSAHQAAKLNREFRTGTNFKIDGSGVTSQTGNIDMINDAIKNNRKLSFNMCEYNMDRKEVMKLGGRVYEASPLALVFNEGFFYMLGCPEGLSEVRAYRIDRIRNLAVTDSSAQLPPEDFDINLYSSHVFDMFNGTMTEVVLDCKDYIMNELVDRFGRDFISERIGGDRFAARVTLDTSPSFYAWVFRFGGDIKIAEPPQVAAEYRAMLEKQLERN